jgi:hypothetical protein
MAEPDAAARPVRAGSDAVGPSPDTVRAQKLLLGGAIGGHAGALIVTVAFFVLRGTASGVSCLIACAITLAFYIVGQAVQVMMADAAPAKVLTASLASYAVRVSALGGLLAIAMTQQHRLSGMDPLAVVVGTVAVVASWLAAEIATFSRLRFPVYDPPSRNPGTGSAR